MKKYFLLFLLAALISESLLADLPFRNQRRDMFRVVPITENSIVFMGNSITQGNEWSELFANDPRVVNRGISGNSSAEIMNNLDYVVAGKPAKVFLMIGINDGADPVIVVPAIRKTIEVIQRESPATQVYIQSILPYGGRENVKITNAILKTLCAEKGVTYLDIYSKLGGTDTNLSLNPAYTNDNLHLLGTGYRKWTEGFEAYTGIVPTIGSGNNVSIPSANHAYVNQRVSDFALLPATSDDILMLGDYHVNTGEWRELLRNPTVKNRGIGVGQGLSCISLPELKEMIPYVVRNHPAKVFISCGAKDLDYNGRTVAQAITSYSEVIAAIRTVAPSTKIYIQSLLPSHNATVNSDRYIPFNSGIAQLANPENRIYFVDVYAGLESNGVLDAQYAWADRGLNGKGYLKWAELLAPYVDASIPTLTAEAYDLCIASSTTQQQLIGIKPAGTAGAYPEEVVTNLKNTLSQTYELAFSVTATAAERSQQLIKLNAALQAVRTSPMTLPKLSTIGESFWYKLSTPLRSGTFVKSNGAGSGVISTAENNYRPQQWKFTLRADNSWNIINRADNSYLNPASATNTQLKTSATEPVTGWTLKPAGSFSKFIITSNEVQLNQTTLTDNMIYNWGGGSNTDDSGCQFLISEVTTEPDTEPVVTAPTPLFRMVNVTCNGTAPVAIAGAHAAPVLAKDTLTIAIDFTPSVTTGDAVLVSASDPSVANKFFGIATLTNFSRTGVRYVGDNGLEGWYTQAYTQPGARHQLVITMSPGASNYNYYMDGAFLRNVSGLGAYGYSTFGKIPNATLYLGGVVSQNAPNRYPFTGTLHSVQIFPGVLTAEQVKWINYDTSPSAVKPLLSPENLKVFSDGKMLRIESDMFSEGEIRINIYNTTGQQVITGTTTGLPVAFPIGNLTSGLYIVTVSSTFHSINENILVKL